MKIQLLNREDTLAFRVFFRKVVSEHQRKKKVYSSVNQWLPG
jgi:hypothetical protein